MEFISVILILIIIFLNVNRSACDKIILPFKTKSYPDTDQFESLLKNEIYIPLQVGEPKQIIEAHLTMKTSYFIIKSSLLNEDFFNCNKSSSYNNLYNSTPYLDKVLKKGIPSKDTFILQKTFNDNEKIQCKDIQFVYGTEVKKVNKKNMAVLGLQFFSSTYSKDINFINTLKQEGLISSYIWLLNYTSNNEGYLILGEYPHEYLPDKYKEEDLKKTFVNYIAFNKMKYRLTFSDIFSGSNPLSSFKTAKLSPQKGVIIGTNDYYRYIEKEFFNKTKIKSHCEKKQYENDYYYFLCDDNVDLSSFENLIFKHKDFSEEFVFTKDDLFIKYNGKKIFLVIFERIEIPYVWTFGKPFFKKYNIIFNQDSKQMMYYNKDIVVNQNSKFNYFTWVIVISLVILIIILFLSIRKLIFGNRKLHANEIEDDFDYFKSNDKKVNNKLGVSG